MPKKQNQNSKLKALRKRAGLTQEELCEKSGIAVRSVSSWENGEVDPSLESLGKLACGLGMSLKEVVSAFDVDTTNIPDDLPNEILELLSELPELLSFAENQTGDEFMATRMKLARLKIERAMDQNHK